MKTFAPHAVRLLIVSAALPALSFAQTSDYPARPVRVVVGLAPGGGTDIQARLFAQKLGESFGRSFVVENRTGAGGTVAYAMVAKSPADGYTLLAVASGFSISPAVYEKLPYDPIKDFTPISLVVQAPLLLVVHPSLPVKSTKELIAFAKSRPGTLNAASAGTGTSNHLALELFRYLSGTNIVHIPYKGAGQALIDVIGGQAHLIFANILSALPYVKAGRLRALAATTAKRSATMPNIPTIAESGVPDYETSTWFGILGPAGLPAPIVDRLSGEIAKILKVPDVAERLAADGGEPVGSTPEQFARHLNTEIARWRKVVKDTGTRLE